MLCLRDNSNIKDISIEDVMYGDIFTFSIKENEYDIYMICNTNKLNIYFQKDSVTVMNLEYGTLTNVNKYARVFPLEGKLIYFNKEHK